MRPRALNTLHSWGHSDRPKWLVLLFQRPGEWEPRRCMCNEICVPIFHTSSEHTKSDKHVCACGIMTRICVIRGAPRNLASAVAKALSSRIPASVVLTTLTAAFTYAIVLSNVGSQQVTFRSQWESGMMPGALRHPYLSNHILMQPQFQLKFLMRMFFKNSVDSTGHFCHLD